MRVAAVQGGLPFDVAISVDDDFVLAWIVAKGEYDGGEFDWETLKWLPRR